MHTYKYCMAILAMMTLAFTSCKKDTIAANTETTVPVSVEFDNIAGGQNLFLNSVNYTNAVGETFNISLLQYFISNIRLHNTSGSWFTVPQDSSYFLIKEADPTTRFAKFAAPEGDYDQLSFVLGVDSLRSTMDISRRTGVLDPAGGMDDGMYWGWNSGYIFFKMEGISPSAPVDPTGQQKFRFHIGGFGGYSAPTLNNIKTITINLTSSGIAQVRKGRSANIHLLVDVLKAMNGTTNISIAANPAVMFGDFSTKVANNYTAMFFHDHTEN